MNDNMVKDPQNNENLYLPYRFFDHVASVSIVNHITQVDGSLNAVSDAGKQLLESRIRTNGTRMFAMAISSSMSMYNLGILLYSYDDDNCPYNPNDSPDKVRLLAALLRDQRLYRTPHFKLGSFDLIVNEVCRLPIDYTENAQSSLGSGANATVYPATIHDGQHSFSNPIHAATPFSSNIAVKVIGREANAIREREFLRLMARHEVNHAHFLLFYGGFRRGPRTYILSELATRTLNEFMRESYPQGCSNNNNSKPGRTWLLGQMRGLAAALNLIHTRIPGSSAYHHDIKPDNILVTGTTDTTRLKIIDFGLAGTKALDNSGGSVGTDKFGNPPYNPPECNHPVPRISSRPHDVWSLGCVFLDLLIWCAGGWSDLHTFREARRRGTYSGRSFYQSNQNYTLIARLNCVNTEINRLLAIGGSNEWQSVVGIVDLMIDCDPATRIDMARVLQSW
jgi:hypothetical protein